MLLVLYQTHQPYYLLIMRALLIPLFFIFVGFTTSVNANGIIDSIGKLIIANNTQELCNFINENIDITIIDEDQTYSKYQAMQVLNEFFKKHQILNFEILHRGNSGNNSEFAIAHINTDKNAFRAYILINKLEKSYQLIELRFEEE